MHDANGVRHGTPEGASTHTAAGTTYHVDEGVRRHLPATPEGGTPDCEGVLDPGWTVKKYTRSLVGLRIARVLWYVLSILGVMGDVEGNLQYLGRIMFVRKERFQRHSSCAPMAKTLR